MSKYVDANDKILYTLVHLQIIAPVCHLKENLALQIYSTFGILLGIKLNDN